MYDGIASRAPRLTTTVTKVAKAYRPSTWKEKALEWTAGLFLVTYLGIVVVLGMIWSTSPGPFDVKEKALALVNNDPAKLVPGTFTVATAIGIAETLLNKSGVVRELGNTQNIILSPAIMNGTGFGPIANHSLVMASYISRANAAVIDLRNLLARG
jgi:hypothetical protein